MKKQLFYFSVFLHIGIGIKSNAQTPFPCDNTMYITNGTGLYEYFSSGTQTYLFEVGNVNALAFSTTGIMWAYNQNAPKSVVTIGADGTITPVSIPGLPTVGINYNVGAIDTNGYYYLYDGDASARFYIIDTDPSRPTTYGQLVDPTATSGVVPYSLDMRTTKGTPISPSIPAANRRIFSDWTINPADGMLYTVTNNASVGSHRLIKYNPLTGAMTEVTGPLTGGAASGGGFQSNVSLGAMFIDNFGNFYVFGNTRGHLYSIDIASSTVTRLSTTSISSSNVDGANCILNTSALPVKLLGFDAYKRGSAAQIEWATASEQNNRGFEIERSTDCRSWDEIGFVNSKAENGSSSVRLDYSFTDNSPANSQNFYRLKQLDFDGKYEYGSVRVVSFDKESNISIYPNPTKDNVIISGLSAGEVIKLYDVSGRLMYQSKAESTSVIIPLGKLSEDVYNISIISKSGNVSSHKVVKNK